MKKFIENRMNDIFVDFQEDLEREKYFCELKKFTFIGNELPNYQKKLHQRFYLLKYLPAYFTEYYYIYNEILKADFLREYSILSLGCGCGIDLWGFKYAEQKRGTRTDLSYKGIDEVEWQYSNFEGGKNNFEKINIKDIEKFESNYNIITFPKSIGEFTEEVFDSLKETLKRTNFSHSKIALVLSARKTRKIEDKKRFDKIIDIFIKYHGYEIQNKEDINEMNGIFKENENGKYIPTLFGITQEIIYPLDKKKYISSLYRNCKKYKEDNTNCSYTCIDTMGRYPVCTMSQAVFQIIYLKK